MKPISEMTLGDLADAFEFYGYHSEADRLREIHAEYERRWNNLSTREKIEAISYPPSTAWDEFVAKMRGDK
jgi:hypothetical protein